MADVVLTDEEKARIRYHFGYPQTNPVASIQLGVPRASQPMFLLEGQLERIPPSAIGIIRDLVTKCDYTEQQIFEGQEYVPASSVGEVDIDDKFINKLQTSYRYWVQRLADTIGAPLNPFAAAFQAGGMPLNVPIIQ
jgi:hypothetical protein